MPVLNFICLGYKRARSLMWVWIRRNTGTAVWGSRSQGLTVRSIKRPVPHFESGEGPGNEVASNRAVWLYAPKGWAKRYKPTVCESLRPNESQSLNSHQLSATLALVWFGPGLTYLAILMHTCAEFLQVNASRGKVDAKFHKEIKTVLYISGLSLAFKYYNWKMTKSSFYFSGSFYWLQYKSRALVWSRPGYELLEIPLGMLVLLTLTGFCGLLWQQKHVGLGLRNMARTSRHVSLFYLQFFLYADKANNRLLKELSHLNDHIKGFSRFVGGKG